ncbi:MAG: spermidine/putrescine ABC transporter substrate-binding protein [Planctomycetaceae bacterium]|nr:spermidine/putrescine ABC transporter substrate-binding protein [Planctomycetaceae bacterium]
MRTRFGVLAALLTCVIGTVCAGERVLHVYTWSDYFDSEVLVQFERENNCRVAVDYFESNEAMYAKLKAGGGGYDVITPSSYMSSVMDGQDMLLPLDHSLIPNLDNMDKNWLRMTEDPSMRYSVPYTRTVTGVGYNSDRVKPEDLGSWDIFANPAYARRMTMLNDMRETIGAALKYLGYSLNTTNEAELAAAGEVLQGWKRHLAKFDVDEAKMGLGSGEFHVIHGYNGDVALIMEEVPEIDFFIPKEGSSVASDDFVIAAGTPAADLAHAFINHLLDPEVARITMESIRYFMPNPKAVAELDPELRENNAFNVDDSVLEKCEVIRDLGEDNAKYIRIWDLVKADE